MNTKEKNMPIPTLLTATAEEEMPLIKELWLYFYDTYFAPSEYYENIKVGTGTMLSIRVIILGLCIGLALAAFASVFNKRVLGGLVRKLLAEEALSPDSAKTLYELGYSKSLVIHWAVKKSTSLRRVVKCREETEFDEQIKLKREEHQKKREQDKSLPRFKETEYKVDSYSDSFYIPEDMKYMADVKFEKKGTTWLGAIVFTLVMAVVFVALTVALPHILGLVDELIGGFKA